MTEDKTRELVRKSILKTSDMFTDDLMAMVELQKNEIRQVRLHFFLACAACFLSFFILASLPSDLHLLRFQLKLPSTATKVIGLLSIMVILNQVILLKDKLLKQT